MTDSLIREHPIIDQVLEANRQAIGPLYPAWQLHSYRMLNVCVRACPTEPIDKFAVGIAFHDLPIMIDGDFRYLEPAAALARAWLLENDLSEWVPEVEAMVLNHHKIRPYRGPYAATVDVFRRADWIDVSLGQWNAGQGKAFLAQLNHEFPVDLLRRALPRIALPYAIRHPWKPFPNLRW